LRTLQHIGLFAGGPSQALAELPKLADPYDPVQNLEARARSYLHVNCSVCHVEAGGGNAKMELGFGTRAERMNLFEARPQHDSFGIDNAMLIFPGDPERSILYQRLARRGRGQMPPLVSTVVDERGLELVRDWIRTLPPRQKFVRDWKMEDLLPRLDQLKNERSLEAGRAAFRQTGCSQCHRLGGDGGSVGPDLTGIGRRLSARDLLEAIVLPSKVIVEGYARTDVEMLSGEIMTGRVEFENDQVVQIRPSGSEERVTIRKADIRTRALSPVSNMPGGIINTLDETQILDLLACMMAEGALDGP
jgi:putative heme-binding domain-containing protein